MINPAISVIVPMYNVERYIKICIDSILAQTFQDFEVIIIDDASPDNSYEICKKLYGVNEKVRIIRHEKNQGLGPARNTGIENARGKYIYFVDSDDAILPKALEILFNVAEKTGADVVHTSRYYRTPQDDDKTLNVNRFFLEKDPYQKEGFLNVNIMYRWERCWRHWNDADGIRAMAWLIFCRKEILQKFSLRFEPIISEDELFSFEVMTYVKKFFVLRQAVYVHRRREGSIMTAYDYGRIEKAIQTLFIASEKIKSVMNNFVEFRDNAQLQEHFIYKIFNNFCKNHVTPFFKKGSDISKLNEVIRASFKKIFGDKSTFTQYFFNLSNMLKVQFDNLNIQAGQLYKAYQKNLKENQHLKNAQKKLSREIVNAMSRCEIISNKIVFINFQGKGYGCNPKYIAEEILRQGLPYDLVWLVKDINEPMPDKIRKVQFNSVDAVFELSTAKVIITNVKNDLPFIKKKNQFFIMTWHGGPTGIKQIEKECEDQLSPSYVAASKRNSLITDLMIVSTRKGFDVMRNSFWYDGEIMKSGLPRHDIFFSHSESLIEKLKKRFNIPIENKILLYGPTFRNNPQKSLEVYKFNSEKLLSLLKKKFGGTWTLLLRFHPHMKDLGLSKTLYKLSDNIIDVTNYPDPQELIVISDALISDYSGLILEFLISKKPVFILAKDLETYPKERRIKSTYFDFPIDKNKTEDELFECIANFKEENYNIKVKEFMSKIGCYDDGHASERVVNVIKSVIDKNFVTDETRNLNL